jgi:hypothetical protein
MKHLRRAYFLLGLGIIIVIILFTISIHKTNEAQHKINQQQRVINQQQKELNAILQDQVSNRTHNVSVWCNSLNSLSKDLIIYVNSVPQAPHLNLPQLNCKKIEAQTLRSAKAK